MLAPGDQLPAGTLLCEVSGSASNSGCNRDSGNNDGGIVVVVFGSSNYDGVVCVGAGSCDRHQDKNYLLVLRYVVYVIVMMIGLVM